MRWILSLSNTKLQNIASKHISLQGCYPSQPKLNKCYIANESDAVKQELDEPDLGFETTKKISNLENGSSLFPTFIEVN